MKGIYLILTVLLMACTSKPGITPQASVTAFTCPVTPFITQRPPDPQTAAFTSTWYGNDLLWAGLAPPYQGRWFAGADGLKVLWYRSAAGTLTVVGKRIDQVGPPLRASIPDGYGQTGYQASGIIFPTDGCWEVVGKVGGHPLTFTVSVLPAAQNPVK